MPWVTQEEKLLCFMVLSDSMAKELTDIAGEAFWRAFIVQNRKTGKITAKYRFKYNDGHRNWFEVAPSKNLSASDTVEYLRDGLETVLKMALDVFGVDPQKIARSIESFYPPDDGGDLEKTLEWIRSKPDLFELTEARDGHTD